MALLLTIIKSLSVLSFRRTQGNILELTEESLDYDLTGSQLRLRFFGGAVLGGVSVHEAHGHVLLLVATTTSVHRLIFPHPNKLDKNVSKQQHLVLFNNNNSFAQMENTLLIMF